MLSLTPNVLLKTKVSLPVPPVRFSNELKVVVLFTLAQLWPVMFKAFDGLDPVKVSLTVPPTKMSMRRHVPPIAGATGVA